MAQADDAEDADEHEDDAEESAADSDADDAAADSGDEAAETDASAPGAQRDEARAIRDEAGAAALRERLRKGSLPITSAEILSSELAVEVAQSGGLRRIFRGFITAVPVLVVGAIGFAILKPALAIQAGLPLSVSAQEVAAQVQLTGGALFAAGIGALLLLLIPWTTGRLAAAGASYLLGLALVLYLLAGVVTLLIDGAWEAALIGLVAALLCGWAPKKALQFARGEEMRVRLTAMLAAGDEGDKAVLDIQGGFWRWIGRFLLALPVLCTGIALLLWIGSVRRKRAARCVCLGALAFLCYLTATAAAQVAITKLDGKLLGTYYPGGGAPPIDLDTAVLPPALWILAVWCLLSALLALYSISREITFQLPAAP